MSQSARRSMSNCSFVSTPSANTLKPRCFNILVRYLIIVNAVSSRSLFMVSSRNCLSSFTVSTATLDNRFNEDAMADAKITIVLTKNYTDPAIGADVETLTQRYWENMLSRIVMVGHAPQELVDLIGYNPVIEVPIGYNSEANFRNEVKNILEHIEDYQPLVDKNREMAVKMAPWKLRMQHVKEWLVGLGYDA